MKVNNERLEEICSAMVTDSSHDYEQVFDGIKSGEIYGMAQELLTLRKAPPEISESASLNEVTAKKYMVAGIYAFVAAVRGQMAKDSEPKTKGDIFFSAGMGAAVDLAEECIKAIQNQQGDTHE